MIYRNEDWCCDDHRKVISREVEPGPRQYSQMQRSLAKELRAFWRLAHELGEA